MPAAEMSDASADPLALLRRLVRIASVNPAGDGESEVAEVLEARLSAAGLTCEILASPEGRPSLVARLPGPSDAPPLVLLSHTDVVPVEQERWTHDPFGAEVVDGELWGRGTLDMKGIAVLHAEAVVALAQSGRTPSREVILVAVADEEAGGAQGAEWLVREHGERVGFGHGTAPEVLGEGAFGLSGILARPIMPIAMGEKAPLVFSARADGEPGHASLPPTRQAIQGLSRFVARVSGPGAPRVHPVMREHFASLARAADGPERRMFTLLAGPGGNVAVRAFAPLLRRRSAALGHVLNDTVTPTRLLAGYKHNVVPGAATATFDCRLLPDTDPDEVLAVVRRVARQHGVTLDELHRSSSATSSRGRLYDAIVDVSAGLPGAPVAAPALTPGITDLRFFRERGADAYGWVPLVLPPELVATVHGDDERMPVEGFHRAVAAMTELVARVAGR